MPRPQLSYLPSGLQIFIIPVVATAIEFLALNIPVLMKITGALGFASISRTQWLNSPILQLASFTGMFVCGWISLPGATSSDTTVVIIQARPETLGKQHINELYANLSEKSLKYEPEIILWSAWLKSDLRHRNQGVGPFAEEYASFQSYAAQQALDILRGAVYNVIQ